MNRLILWKEQKREAEMIKRVSDVIERDATCLDKRTTESIATAIYRISKTKNIDYRIVLALAKVESNFKNDAVSPKGARGLLQVKPSVAREIAKDLGMRIEGKRCLHDYESNVALGTHLLSKLIQKFDDVHTALTAYNIGETRLLSLNRQRVKSKFSESVLKEYKRYVEILPDP